jgi:hypothetical protein
MLPTLTPVAISLCYAVEIETLCMLLQKWRAMTRYEEPINKVTKSRSIFLTFMTDIKRSSVESIPFTAWTLFQREDRRCV